MGLRRFVDLILQVGNIIVVVGCVLALLAAHQYSTGVVQVTTLSEAPTSISTTTVTVTTTHQSTTSSTCSPCSFTEILPQGFGVSASLGGEVHHTTTVLNPAALSTYEFLVELGEYLAIAGLIFSVTIFSIWVYRKRSRKPTA